MTPQDLFDRVARHLILQGCKATDLHGGCAYRAPDGSRCAIGCLIPDDQYDPRMEGIPVVLGPHRPHIRKPELIRSRLIASVAGITPELLPLARALQRVHDDTEVDDWPRELRRVADQHHLSPAAIGAALAERNTKERS